MVEVTRKPFKAVEIDGTRIEEEFVVEITVESGEEFIGMVTKIETKKITIHIADEVGDRIFMYAEIEDIRVL